ncbi:MAG: hypothetical protein DHS20C09_19460 [marine bacterium B5-7]|nr:MAG: hypothetical protein DHS20C09_19460 [marine bacterium B5-7]
MNFSKNLVYYMAVTLLLLAVNNVCSATDYQQQAFLKASNPDFSDLLGSNSVAISNNTLVIGAMYEDSNATGVNGDQSNNDASQSGAVYIFTRQDGVWSQQAYLKASNTDTDDFFGYAVDIFDDTVVVGAPNEDSDATGVNGDESNNDAASSGAVYVFTRNAGIWSQQAYLKASNPDSGDFFGSSVAISGNKVVVGAQLESSDATGVNGDESNNNSTSAGAAYVFSRNAGMWSQEAYLKASNTDAGDGFGIDVAISGTSIVVGAYGEQSGSTGVNGDENNRDASGSGAAYVFIYDTGNWQQQAYLKASNTDELDWFGYAVDIAENTVVIGAYREDSDSVGIDADGSNNDADESGAAYVFTRSLGIWSQQAYIKAFNTEADDSFGKSVSISGNNLVIGAFHEDSNATGVDGDERNNDVEDAGAAYIFTRNAGIWQQLHYLKSENPAVTYYFGHQVAVSENTVLLSEQNEGFFVPASGAAYVFNQPNSYGLNVAVTGLMSDGLVLQNNGADDLVILSNGISQFAAQLAEGESYQVTISSQPNNSDHTCLFEGSHAGVITSTAVLIKVRCADFIFVDDFE